MRHGFAIAALVTLIGCAVGVGEPVELAVTQGDLAEGMLRQLTDRRFVRSAPYVATQRS